MWIPRLKLLAAALLFSTGGMAIKSCQLPDWQIASFRCGIAGLVLLAFMPAARRRWSWRHPTVGLAFAGTLILYALANKATTHVNAIFLQSTAPLYIFLAGPWLLGERNRRHDLVVMGAMAFGLLLLLTGRVETTAVAPDPVRGNLYGVLAGVCWASTLMGLRWLSQHGDGTEGGSMPAVVAGNLIAFLVALPMALPVTAAAPSDWMWLIYLGIFQVALAYMLLASAMASIPAFEASIVLLVEPVFGPLWTWWTHGERPGTQAFAGALLILLATSIKPWLDRRLGA